MPFLINPTVPTSTTDDLPVLDLRARGPGLGLTMPYLDRSPNMKLAMFTIRQSTIVTGTCWTNVIPKRINPLVIMCTYTQNDKSMDQEIL